MRRRSPVLTAMGRPSRVAPVRIFGPPRSCRIATSRRARAAASRTRLNVADWDACVPCEKLRRKTSTPAAISPSSSGSVSLAGPTVAMIFVRRMYNPLIMGQIVPDAVEQYLGSLNHQSDRVLTEIARAGKPLGTLLIDPEVGALLRVLTLTTRATRVLEIGTAIGYSGVWIAGVLPKDGMLITMELDEQRATIA